MENAIDFVPVLLGPCKNSFSVAKELFRKYGSIVYFISDEVSIKNRLNLYLHTQNIPVFLWQTALHDLAVLIMQTGKTPFLIPASEKATEYIAAHPEIETEYLISTK